MSLSAETIEHAPESDLLGFLIVDAARLLRAAFESRITQAGLGLTAGEARALINISDHEGNRQLDIAARMGVEPMTLCAYLDKLQALGLIERQTCTADRRAKRIALTPASAEMIGRIRVELRGIIGDATAGISQQHRGELEASLKTLSRNLQRDYAAPSTRPDETR